MGLQRHFNFNPYLFLQDLYLCCTQGHVRINKNKKQHLFSFDISLLRIGDRGELKSFLAEYIPKDGDIYFEHGFMVDPCKKSSHLEEGRIWGSCFYSADWDVPDRDPNGPVKEGQVEKLFQIISGLDDSIVPNYIVNTGRGIQGHWNHEIVLFRTEKDAIEFEAKCAEEERIEHRNGPERENSLPIPSQVKYHDRWRQFVSIIDQIIGVKGVESDTVFNSGHLFRLPGSIHPKQKKEVQVFGFPKSRTTAELHRSARMIFKKKFKRDLDFDILTKKEKTVKSTEVVPVYEVVIKKEEGIEESLSCEKAVKTTEVVCQPEVTREKTIETKMSLCQSPLEQATEWIKNEAQPAVEGEDGHTTALRVATHIQFGFGLTPEQTEELLVEEYNKKCIPPFEGKDLAQLRRKAYQAKIDSGQTIGYLLNKKSLTEMAQSLSTKIKPVIIEVIPTEQEEVEIIPIPKVDDKELLSLVKGKIFEKVVEECLRVGPEGYLLFYITSSILAAAPFLARRVLFYPEGCAKGGLTANLLGINFGSSTSGKGTAGKAARLAHHAEEPNGQPDGSSIKMVERKFGTYPWGLVVWDEKSDLFNGTEYNSNLLTGIRKWVDGQGAEGGEDSHKTGSFKVENFAPSFLLDGLPELFTDKARMQIHSGLFSRGLLAYFERPEKRGVLSFGSGNSICINEPLLAYTTYFNAFGPPEKAADMTSGPMIHNRPQELWRHPIPKNKIYFPQIKSCLDIEVSPDLCELLKPWLIRMIKARCVIASCYEKPQMNGILSTFSLEWADRFLCRYAWEYIRIKDYCPRSPIENLARRMAKNVSGQYKGKPISWKWLSTKNRYGSNRDETDALNVAIKYDWIILDKTEKSWKVSPGPNFNKE